MRELHFQIKILLRKSEKKLYIDRRKTILGNLLNMELIPLNMHFWIDGLEITPKNVRYFVITEADFVFYIQFN